jgi:hypothetical protein
MRGEGSEASVNGHRGPYVSEAYSNDAKLGRVSRVVTVSKGFKVALVALDCLFLGLQPVLVHLSKNKKGTYSFHPVAVRPDATTAPAAGRRGPDALPADLTHTHTPHPGSMRG